MNNTWLERDSIVVRLLKAFPALLIPISLLILFLVGSSQSASARPNGRQEPVGVSRGCQLDLLGSTQANDLLVTDFPAEGMNYDRKDIFINISKNQISHTICLPLILRNFCSACNEGFERRDFSCWVDSGLLNRSVQSQVVDQGDYAALLGSPHYLCQSGVPFGSARIYQFFPVPSCSNPALSFSYQIRSNDRLQGDRSDSFDVYVNDTLILRGGNKEWEKANCGRSAWSSGWKTFTYDLSDYQGQCIQVTFVNASRGSHWFNTWTYLDDVQVTCQP